MQGRIFKVIPFAVLHLRLLMLRAQPTHILSRFVGLKKHRQPTHKSERLIALMQTTPKAALQRIRGLDCDSSPPSTLPMQPVLPKISAVWRFPSRQGCFHDRFEALQQNELNHSAISPASISTPTMEPPLVATSSESPSCKDRQHATDANEFALT